LALLEHRRAQGDCLIIATACARGAPALSAPAAPENAKAMAKVCPDAYSEMPGLADRWYHVVVDAIEKTGGPSLIDHVAPATRLVERAAKARWPRCIAYARSKSTTEKNRAPDLPLYRVVEGQSDDAAL
jgi:hypothetical protein